MAARSEARQDVEDGARGPLAAACCRDLPPVELCRNRVRAGDAPCPDVGDRRRQTLRPLVSIGLQGGDGFLLIAAGDMRRPLRIAELNAPSLGGGERGLSPLADRFAFLLRNQGHNPYGEIIGVRHVDRGEAPGSCHFSGFLDVRRVT